MGKPFPYNVPAGSGRGAPMGRQDQGPAPDSYAKVRMRQVRLINGGYDGGGAYWGQRPRGMMLFCAWTPDRHFVRYLDAPSYLAAQELIREEAPQVDFL